MRPVRGAPSPRPPPGGAGPPPSEDPRRGPGAGTAGPRDRDTVRRSQRGPPAGLDGRGSSDVLRRDPGVHPSHGVLLSRDGQERRPPAATRVCAGLARPPPGSPERGPADPGAGRPCPTLAPRRARRSDRSGAPVARGLAPPARATPSQSPQQPLAEPESLVRGGGGAAPARAGQARPAGRSGRTVGGLPAPIPLHGPTSPPDRPRSCSPCAWSRHVL